MPDFTTPKFTTSQLIHSPAISEWTSLRLLSTGVDDIGFDFLGKVATSLTRLEIESDVITDRGFSSVARLPQLVSLQMYSASNITDQGISALEHAIKIEMLGLASTQCTDRGLQSLHNLQALRTLNLCGTRVTDGGLDGLQCMKFLSALDLSDTMITGSGFRDLQIARMATLSLDRCPVSDDGVKALADSFPSLSTCQLSGTEVSNCAMPILAALKCLYDLRLNNTSITDDGVLAFCQHPSLRYIYLKGAPINRLTIKQFLASIPRKVSVFA
jgi:hypothetical protein